MKIKTITYQRVLNLGNYESKRLDMTIEVDANLEFAEEECSILMESVERKIREESEALILNEIRDARKKLREVNKEIEAGKQLLAEIGKELNPDIEPGLSPYEIAEIDRKVRKEAYLNPDEDF